MKSILQNLCENWITYGFETLVVVMGILGAFALNNWNEERKSRIKETELLQELRKGAEINIGFIEASIK